MVELSDQGFKATKIPTEKRGNIQEQMGNISREMQILKKNQEGVLEIKTTGTELKSAFDGLISRPDSGFENISKETSKT